MMREIKFKARRKDNNELIEGYYVYEKYSNRHYITKQLENAHQLIEVIPETVCQYTGLNDKNGVEIYENDIVKARYEENNGYIKWNSDNASFQVKGIPSHTLKRADELEVIGNVYDKEVK